MKTAGDAVITPASETVTVEAPTAAPQGSTRSGLINAASNVGVALLFFMAFLPNKFQHASYHSGVADDVWLAGALLMGLFSLVRVPPRSSMVTVSSVAATVGMMLLPSFIRPLPGTASIGLLHSAGLTIELVGVLFTQVARVYLGRSFGLLPANRGIVSNGPFRLMRHPIYTGWLMLSIGYVLIYPALSNALTIVAVLPFMMWRIGQEEALLSQDPEYRGYMERVRYRVIPYLL
jgi:protein-S-isoprenylcysteine O-methyltransferase Ste14